MNMGIFMVTVWVPPEKGVDMAKLYLKQPREIPFVTKWRVFNTTGGVDGTKQYHLIYTEREKVEAAGKELNKYFLPFMNIEGFRYQIEMLTGVSDTYEMLGMKW
jgi:hypothetical protein